MAENQRGDKELAAVGEEKGAWGKGGCERESERLHHWALGKSDRCAGKARNTTRTEEGTPEPRCMQMRGIPQVYAKTEFNSSDCPGGTHPLPASRNKAATQGKGHHENT